MVNYGQILIQTKGDDMKIRYIEDDVTCNCSTPCPDKSKIGWTVGSSFCKLSCKNFIGKVFNDDVIECGYKIGENK